MTIEGARTLVQHYFDDVLSRGDLAVIDEILAPEFALYAPPSLGDGPQTTGRGGFRDLVTGLRTSFPDVHFTVHEVTANDDTIMASWTMTGTYQAEWAGTPATGRRVSLTGVDVFKMADGLIVEERIHGDYLGFLRQLDAIA